MPTPRTPDNLHARAARGGLIPRPAAARLVGALALALALLLPLPGCDAASDAATDASQNPPSGAAIEQTDAATADDQEADAPDAADSPADASDQAAVSLDEIPSYAGDLSVEINDGQPGFSPQDAQDGGFEAYSPLDDLGRCSTAYALVGPETLPDAPRGDISKVKPTGWHSTSYDDLDQKALYNRSHLIAHRLAGEDANERNLITGTRTMNVQGMLPYEDIVGDYVEQTGNHVLYRVTPVFEGDELVARGVQMEGLSVEDDGASVRFNVFVYNIQPGVIIDYATGDSGPSDAVVDVANNDAINEGSAGASSRAYSGAAKDGAGVQASPSAGGHAASGTNETGASDEETRSYVLNTNSMKFHYPACSSVDDMAARNKQDYTGTRDALIAQGYTPCGRCNP